MIYLRIFGVWLSVCGGLLFGCRYSKWWDRKLNQLLNTCEAPTCIDEDTVRVGGIEIWIGNRWYAYAYPHDPLFASRYERVRPSIRTMIRLHDAIERAVFE